MSKVAITKEKITAVADAIREKAGTTEELTLDEMPTKIAGIETGGGEFECFVNGSGIPKNFSYDGTKIKDHLYYDEYLNSLNIPNVTTIGYYAFYCSTADVDKELHSIGKLENLKYIRDYAFCKRLASIYAKDKDDDSVKFLNFPNVLEVGASAFEGCTSIQTANFPKAITLKSSVFKSCRNLTKVELNALTATKNQILDGLAYGSTDGCVVYMNSLESINAKLANYNQAYISKLVLGSPAVCTLGSTSYFDYTWIKTKTDTGFVYVPDDLVDSYKTATNWTTFADKIKPMSELESEATA